MVKKVVAAWWLSSTALSLYRSAIGSLAATRNALVRPGWSTSWHNAARARANISSSFNLCAPSVRVSNKYLQPTFHSWFQNPNCTSIKHKQHDLHLLHVDLDLQSKVPNAKVPSFENFATIMCGIIIQRNAISFTLDKISLGVESLYNTHKEKLTQHEGHRMHGENCDMDSVGTALPSAHIRSWYKLATEISRSFAGTFFMLVLLDSFFFDKSWETKFTIQQIGQEGSR